jgi:D-3-phosphoglycerate dehydrogenase
VILASEWLHPDAVAQLGAHSAFSYEPDLHADPGALLAAARSAEALIVRNQTRVNAALLDHAPRLKVVGRVGVGLDNLELAALKARGVAVTWAPGTNAVSVAEWVMGAMVFLARRFGEVSSALHAGRWDRQTAVGSELYGKTLGIVGLGDIGGRLARRAAAFGLRVVAHDPAVQGSALAVQEFGVTLVDLDTLLAGSDVVSLHLPLLKATRHLLGAKALAKMKPTAHLINTARGGLVDEWALAEALRAGRLAGAALDVRAQEPPGQGDPLRGLPNVLLTPHVAGVTEEANRRASLRVAEDVLRVLRGEPPVSPLAL